MKPKKSLGQHFLKDESIARRIAGELTLQGECTNVLEVGPGKGMLTQFLIDREYELAVVEADSDMVRFLKTNLPALNGNIIEGDFLRTHVEKIFDGAAFALIGNFPYNISSQIVFKMVKYRQYIPEMVGMFQKEMAERIIAAPGSKTYGVISVLTQAYYQGEMLFTVGPGAFNPPPKVKSAVIRLVRREEQHLDCDEGLFKAIVKTTFNQRRKMLRNTMKTFIKGDPLLDDPFLEKRPEQLSVQEFVELTREVEKRVT